MHTPLTKTKVFILGGVLLTFILIVIILVLTLREDGSDWHGRDVLNSVPLTIGSNNLSYELKRKKIFTVNDFDMKLFPELDKAKVGIQIWNIETECNSQFKDALPQVIDQIDFLTRLFIKAESTKLVTTVEEISQEKKNGKVASLLSISGGHTLEERSSVLRAYKKLGVSIISLANTCSTPWSKGTEKSTEFSDVVGLTEFGIGLVKEMNRLGFVIDLTGSDKATQLKVLETSTSPVIFSNVGLESFKPGPLSISDEVLNKIKSSDGVVMLSLDCNIFAPQDNCTKETYKRFLQKGKELLDAKHLGIGAFSGKLPSDLNLTNLPVFFDELGTSKWTKEELEGLAGENFLRILKAVEENNEKLKESSPFETLIPLADYKKTKLDCYTDLDVRYKMEPTPSPAPTTTPAPAPTSQTTPAPATTPTPAPISTQTFLS